MVFTHHLCPSRITTGNGPLLISRNCTASFLSHMRQKTGSAILCNVRVSSRELFDRTVGKDSARQGAGKTGKLFVSPRLGALRGMYYVTVCFHCRRLLICLYGAQDRKSTRLNSSHTVISYAVFCLKKKT